MPLIRGQMGDGGGGHWLVWMEWRPAGWSACLPLLIFPCTIKSRSSLLAPAHPGGPGKRAVQRLWIHGHNNATFPATDHQCRLAYRKLQWLVTKAREQLANGHHMTVKWLGLKAATYRSQDRCPIKHHLPCCNTYPS